MQLTNGINRTSYHLSSLYIVYVPIARVYPSILLVNHIRGTDFNSCTYIFPTTHRIFVALMKNDFTRSKYWHLEH